jgi:transposase InsO family protein
VRFERFTAREAFVFSRNCQTLEISRQSRGGVTQRNLLAGSDDHLTQSGAGDGSHVPPHAPRLPRPGHSPRLGDPPRLTWRVSNTMTTDVCPGTQEAAIRDSGYPGSVHTNQGSQFTSTALVDLVQQHGIQLSMDGKGPGATTCSSRACGRV